MGNSIIRDIFGHLGYDVVKVDCVAIAHLTKKDEGSLITARVRQGNQHADDLAEKGRAAPQSS